MSNNEQTILDNNDEQKLPSSTGKKIRIRIRRTETMCKNENEIGEKKWLQSCHTNTANTEKLEHVE